MEPQALVLVIIYGLCVAAALVKVIRARAISGGTIVGFVLSVLYIMLLAFDTACLTAGGCKVWSWIRTALYCIAPVLFLIFYAATLGSKPAVKQEQEAAK